MVLIGATGCGKTYLVRFIAEVLFQEKLFILNVHSGTEVHEIETKIAEVKQYLDNNLNCRAWLMFDEFNTSIHQAKIVELFEKVTFMKSREAKLMKEKLGTVGVEEGFRLFKQGYAGETEG